MLSCQKSRNRLVGILSMSKVITSDVAKCVGCNKCIMVCPIKFANNVVIIDDERKIEIDDVKCISCGRCIQICDHGVRSYIDDSDRFWEDLANSKTSGEKISVIVAPSFVANKYNDYKRVFGYLKSLGVNLIYDVSFGADIASWTYVNHLKKENKPDFYMAQPCPPVVNYIEKYMPNLIEKLMPAQSPAISTAIYLKKYDKVTDKIAFLSPCIAKKEEFEKEFNPDFIDYSVTFEMFFKHLESKNINLLDYPEVDFDNIQSGLGATLSRPGGLKDILLYHLPDLKIKQIEGQSRIYDYLKYLSSGRSLGNYDFVDVLNCSHGCNVGTASFNGEDTDLNVSIEFEKEILNDRRVKNQNKRIINLVEYDKLFEFFDETLTLEDFSIQYQDKSALIKPTLSSENDIEGAFAILRKNDEASRNINCYSCGYKTCKDMAIAICNNLNVPSSCYQYNKKELEFQKNNVEVKERYIRTILEYLSESVIVTNRYGVIEFVNREVQETFGSEPSVYINKHIRELFKDINIEEMKDGTGYEFQITDNNEKARYFELKRNTIYFNYEPLYIFIIVDITKNKELDDLKNQFVSMISHELRTPLTSIRGALGLISSGVLGDLPSKVKELVNIAGNNSIRLVNLINDILDLEKMKAGKMEFIIDEHEIISLIEETVTFNEEYAKQYNVKYEIVKKVDNGLVNVDKDRFIQVLTNLLSNAAKFSIPNEIVNISVEKNNNLFRVSVTNKGVGIPSESRAKIFESFSQINSSVSKNKGGTGLGLSICKSIMQKMGGNIDFESIPNEKTTFYFELPEVSKKGNEEYVLICEDDSTTAFCIQKMFEKMGYIVDIAYSAQEALEFLTTKEYKLMTIDVLLPDKNGLILLDEIKNNEQTKDLPVIIISATEEDSVNLKANNKIVAWLEKSFDTEKLEDIINKTLTNKNNKVKILHVEHDEDVLNIVSSTLKDIACISAVDNLVDAEKILNENTFDLIIFDYVFPNGTCEQLIDKIKETQNKDAKLILLSAYEIKPSLAERVDLVICKTRVSYGQFLCNIKSFIDENLFSEEFEKLKEQMII